MAGSTYVTEETLVGRARNLDVGPNALVDIMQEQLTSKLLALRTTSETRLVIAACIQIFGQAETFDMINAAAVAGKNAPASPGYKLTGTQSEWSTATSMTAEARRLGLGLDDIAAPGVTIIDWITSQAVDIGQPIHLLMILIKLIGAHRTTDLLREIADEQSDASDEPA